MSRKRKEVEELQAFESERGLSSDSSLRGIYTTGRLIRGHLESVLPFTVNQGEEGTCVYVTLAKLLVFNLLGLVMDIRLSDEEQEKINVLTRLFPIRSNTHSLSKQLKHSMISPQSASPKGFALLVMFFYFYDWLKSHDMRPYYFFGDKVRMKHKDRTEFTSSLKKLYGFLKLTTKRLGGQTFSASGWVDAITTQVSPYVADITWKTVSLCTLQTRFGRESQTFGPQPFDHLCHILFEITKKFKIMLTLRVLVQDKYALHEVMIVGIEGHELILSKSWGVFLDKVPIPMLPDIILRTEEDELKCKAFQFTFLLPMVTPVDFDVQYDLSTFGEFLERMEEYLPQMDALNAIPKLDPALFDALAERPMTEVGGRRTRRIR